MRMEQRTFYQPVQVEQINRMFAGDPEDPDELPGAYRYALDLLESTAGDSLAATTVALTDADSPGSSFDDGTVRHFRDHWLAEDGPMPGADIERVMRAGYTEAIKLALEHDPPLPLETLWLTDDVEDYEIFINEGSRRITLVAAMPRDLAGDGAPQADTASRSWVVRVARDGDEAVTRETLDAGDRPVVRMQMSGPAAAS